MSYTIRTKSDLRAAYYFARVLPKSDFTDDIKRKIRAYVKEHEQHEQLVKDYGVDGYICKFQLPDYIETAEDAEHYFKSECYITARPSLYDCTGDMFTSWYKIFERGGKFFAYHSVGVDV